MRTIRATHLDDGTTGGRAGAVGVVVGLVALALVVAGCVPVANQPLDPASVPDDGWVLAEPPVSGTPAGGVTTPTGTEAARLVLAGGLGGFGGEGGEERDACAAFLAHVQEHALQEVTAWGLGLGPVWPEMLDDGAFDAVPADPSLEAAPTAPLGEVPAADAPVAGEDFSATNVQEAGVDEPDIVKTDGRTLFVVVAGHLEVVDLTASSPRRIASVALDGAFDAQLLLVGDRLLVTSAQQLAVPLATGTLASAPAWPSHLGGTTTLLVMDVADPADPQVVERLTLDGTVRAARLVDGVARVVVRTEPGTLPWVTPQGSGLRAERAALEANRELIRTSRADDWIPWYLHETIEGTLGEGPLVDCTRIAHPQEYAGLGMLSVLTVDLADGSLRPGSEAFGLLAGGDTVYASRESLYVATTRWESPDGWSSPHERTTEVHGFDLRDPRDVTYLGSGSVPGTLLSQWALSEHDGVLRVASTVGDAWGPEPSESLVTVLAANDGVLEQVGQVTGLGPTERIYAVRFLGDRGYVVTFRETDPLYTIDLSDPTAPRATGELKILGYSAYLHPIGDDLLLGVGQDATEDGWLLGTQLSLFDIRDDDEPLRIDQVTIGSGSSAIEHDHRAFLHWAPSGLTVVPYIRYDVVPGGWDDEVAAGAVGFTADRADGLQRVGQLSHAALVEQRASDLIDPGGSFDVAGSPPGDALADLWWELGWQAQILRSVVVDEHLLTVSEIGVVVHDLDTLHDVATVHFGS